MQLQIWKISGRGFHFGQHGLGQEETAAAISSDSLFAALVARLAEIEGGAAVDTFMQPFKADSPPFVLTSTFPFAGQVYFFPAPAIQASEQARGSSVQPKELKQVQIVSQTIFRRLLAGDSLQEHFPKALKLQGRRCLVSPEETTDLPANLRQEGTALWDVDQRPRVTLGRGAQNSSLFFTGRLAFAEDCGLWFGIRWLAVDPDLQRKLSFLLEDLAIAGLGGERSAGFGDCRIELQPEPMELPDAQGQHWITLSRYLPRPDESSALQDPAASYKIEPVGGWLDSPVRRGQRRRPVNLITEGAILGPLNSAAPGQIVDVRPVYPSDPDPLGHAVYRSGLALGVGLKGGAR